MGKVGQPNVVVMTSGGNNCGFGHIIDVCIYHSEPWRNYSLAYADDTNRTGECAKALDQASSYISGGLQQDLINTINDIIADPNIKNTPDFLLYLTGYAQFFGTDYDPWCNEEYWNVLPEVSVSPYPYLSVELRQAFNQHITQINQLYSDTIQQHFARTARYIDVDAGFNGHRFCEKGASLVDQFNTDTDSQDVYLWNLNWPYQVYDVPPPDGTGSWNNLTADEVEDLFGGNGVTAWSGSGSGGNSPDDGWRLRPFHPRQSGYTSIKDAIIKQLKADGLP